MALTVTLLADALTSAEAVAEMRWQEWGHPPEPEDPAWWLETTVRESGREELPVTFVAHDQADEVVGAVAAGAPRARVLSLDSELPGVLAAMAIRARHGIQLLPGNSALTDGFYYACATVT